jgi:hypothetical protein
MMWLRLMGGNSEQAYDAYMALADQLNQQHYQAFKQWREMTLIQLEELLEKSKMRWP